MVEAVPNGVQETDHLDSALGLFYGDRLGRATDDQPGQLA
jgi:hypothetical protein